MGRLSAGDRPVSQDREQQDAARELARMQSRRVLVDRSISSQPVFDHSEHLFRWVVKCSRPANRMFGVGGTLGVVSSPMSN